MRSDYLQKDHEIHGEILYLRFLLDTTDLKKEDEFLYTYANKNKEKIKSQINEAVRSGLGSDFNVQSITYYPGSLTILVVIGTTYYAISRYKSFIESVELLVSQIRNLLSTTVSQGTNSRISASSNWIPGPGLIQLDSQFSSSNTDLPTRNRTSERILFSEDETVISTGRITISGNHYFINQVASCKVDWTDEIDKIKDAYRKTLLLFSAIMGIYLGFKTKSFLLGVFFTILGMIAALIFLNPHYKLYHLRLGMSSGEIDAVHSKSREYLLRMSNAINEAMGLRY